MIFNNCIVPKKREHKVTLPERKIKNYFPPNYTQLVEDIIDLLNRGRNKAIKSM